MIQMGVIPLIFKFQGVPYGGTRQIRKADEDTDLHPGARLVIMRKLGG